MACAVHAGDLDDAVLDRMDEALEFGLPSVSERKRMLELYLERCVCACVHACHALHAYAPSCHTFACICTLVPCLCMHAPSCKHVFVHVC